MLVDPQMLIIPPDKPFDRTLPKNPHRTAALEALKIGAEVSVCLLNRDMSLTWTGQGIVRAVDKFGICVRDTEGIRGDLNFDLEYGQCHAPINIILVLIPDAVGMEKEGG